ncbi:MAG: 16S rRNA (cytosine(1402)-N(4))-methyltransferase, partial [Patescibacteria group bacterium]
MTYSHIPVLLQPACASLNIHSGEKYIDATLGGGGHAQEIIRLGGLVLGIDQD